MDNPFAPKSTTTNTTKENNMSETPTNNKLTVTLKGGSGFDAPWIVLHGDTAAELLEQLNDEALKALIEQTSAVGKFFADKGPQAQGNRGGGGGGRSGAPQGAQQPPAGAPEAPGPDWVFKSGTSKAGKPWKAWMPPQGSDEKPLFFN